MNAITAKTPKFTRAEITYVFPLLKQSEQDYYQDLKAISAHKSQVYLRERFDVLLNQKPVKIQILNQLLQRGPLFAREITDACTFTDEGFRYAITELLTKGLVYSSDVTWKETERQRTVYYLEGQDLTRFQSTRIGKLETLLRERPYTLTELCEKTGSTIRQVRHSLYDLAKIKGLPVHREYYYYMDGAAKVKFATEDLLNG